MSVIVLKQKPQSDTFRYRPRHRWYLDQALRVVRDYSDKDLDLYFLPIYKPGEDHDVETLILAVNKALGREGSTRDTQDITSHLHRNDDKDTCFDCMLHANESPTLGPMDIFVVAP